MRYLERITFLVAVACVFLSAGEALAAPKPIPIEYVTCVRDGATCNSATAGKACAVNKTCSANASNPCTCL